MSDDSNAARDVFPAGNPLISTADRASRTGASGGVIWLYGLSGSGKSTIANGLERRLYDDGITTCILDGDNLRSGLTRHLGFSDDARRENIRIAAEVAKLLLENAMTVICAFITPRQELRDLARQIIGPEKFLEVFVDCSLGGCESRDVKGLYARARANSVPDFTGKQSLFERPQAPDLLLDTENSSIHECVGVLYRVARTRLTAKP